MRSWGIANRFTLYQDTWGDFTSEGSWTNEYRESHCFPKLIETLTAGDCPDGYARGDVNQDGSINQLDIQPFVSALNGGSYNCQADTNEEGFVNLLDVEPFVALLQQ